MRRSPHLRRRRRGRGHLLLGEQAVLHREHRGRGPARGADLGVDVLDVIAGRLRRDDQPGGDLLVGQAAGEQDAGPRPRARSARPGLPAPRQPVPGRGQHGLDGVAVQAAGPDLGAAARAAASLGGQARPVRPWLAHRGVRVGGAEDPRGREIAPPDSPRGYPLPSSRSRCCTAISPSGASAADWCSIRSVRYGCIRTRSHSPAPSGPGLSQIEFETPSRPKPCTSPARRSVRTCSGGSPSCSRPLGQLGDGARVARACTATSGRRSWRSPPAPVELVRRQVHRQRGLGRDHGPRPGPRPARRRSPRAWAHSSAASAGSNCRPPACGQRGGPASSADPVRDLDELGQLGDPGRDRDRVGPAARRASRARPTARTRRRPRRGTACREPELLGQRPRQLRRAGRSSRPARGARRTRTRGRPGTGAAAGCPRPTSRIVASAAHAAELVVVLAGLQRDVVAEPLRLLVGIGVTAHVDEQGRVVDDRPRPARRGRACSASRSAIRHWRSTCSIGWPKPRSTPSDSAATSSASRARGILIPGPTRPA